MEENFKVTLSFTILNSRDFYNKLKDEYNDFNKNHLNARFAINCALTSWHLSDWTYNEFFKEDKRFQDGERRDNKGCIQRISGLTLYQQSLIEKCPELKYMKLICNGSKHCILRDINSKEKTFTSSGSLSSAFARKGFNVPRFKVELIKGKEIDFEECLLRTIDFWELLLTNRIL